MIRRLLIVFMVCLPAWASATTYYVSSEHGSDADDGLTNLTPWATLAKVSATSFTAGDSILLERGSEWHEQLTVTSSGSADNPITFGAYGSGAAPIINRADATLEWARQGLLLNAGFGGYSGSGNTVNFENITETRESGTTITVDAAGYHGESAKLQGAGGGTGWDDGACAFARYSSNLGIAGDAAYFLSYAARVDNAATGTLMVQLRASTGTSYLYYNGSAWTANSLNISQSQLSQTLNTWNVRTLAFTMPTTAGALQITWSCSIGTALLDDIYLTTGSAVGTAVWAGRRQSGFAQQHGYVIEGTRGVDLGTTTTAFTALAGLQDGQFVRKATGVGYFYMRRDAGIPTDAEIGARSYAILIDGRSYITVENLTATGPSAFGTGTVESLVCVTGAATSVTISNCTMTNGTGNGFDAAVGTTSVTITGCTARYNSSNGIFNGAAGGLVSNCTATENKRLLRDTGDGYGVGSGDNAGAITIDSCTIGHNGPDDDDCDAELNVFEPGGLATITNNLITTCAQGGIMLYTDSALAAGSVIRRNTVSGFGTCTYSGEPQTGKYSGVTLRGTAANAASSVTVENNTLVGTEWWSGATAGVAVVSVGFTSLTIRSNIVQGPCMLTLHSSNADTTGVVVDYNLYYRSDDDYTSGWVWDGTFYGTLAAWQSKSGQDAASTTTDPLFDSTQSHYYLSASSPAIGAGFGGVDCGSHPYVASPVASIQWTVGGASVYVPSAVDPHPAGAWQPIDDPTGIAGSWKVR